MSSAGEEAVEPDPRMIFAFDNWTFEPASGQLRHDEASPVRLQPQPAQLLTILLDRAGEVVTRDDIIGSVWGHTTVEFDQAVNYCIRQIRIALGESATDSRYIETLPRRGYRFLVPVVRRTAEPDRPVRRLILWPAAAIAVVVLGSATILASRGMGAGSNGDGGASERPVIAVMTLRHAAGDTAAGTAGVRIAEALTAVLTEGTAGRYRVVGPTTTGAYGSDRAAMERLRAELEAAYVLGGSIATGQPDGLFLELIDTRDGAHLWAMTGDAADRTVADLAADSVRARLVSHDTR